MGYGGMRPASPRPRLPDWPERLAAFVEARRALPFAWGTNDCCMFIGDAMLALTGVDRAAPWRGAYSSEAGAQRFIDGAGGLLHLVRQAHAMVGAAEIDPEFAQRGDTALITLRNMPSVGVVLDGVVAAPGLRGLEFVPVTLATHAWVT